jgi:hypothetical protein
LQVEAVVQFALVEVLADTDVLFPEKILAVVGRLKQY